MEDWHLTSGGFALHIERLGLHLELDLERLCLHALTMLESLL